MKLREDEKELLIEESRGLSVFLDENYKEGTKLTLTLKKSNENKVTVNIDIDGHVKDLKETT